MATGMSEAVGGAGNNEGVAEEALAPLRALDAALSKRIVVKTSYVQLRDNDEPTRAHVDVDGSVVTDQSTLQILEESISDVVSIRESSENLPVTRPGPAAAAAAAEEEEEERAIGSWSAANLSSGRDQTDKSAGGSFYSIPSCCSNFEGPVTADSLKKAERVIADLEANGPAGLVHLSSLSAAIGKPIRVWCSGSDKGRTVGRSRIVGGEPVDVEYHEAETATGVGHWTLRNNEEPARDRQARLNDCLFGVVADQIDCLAPELRRRTIERMRSHVGSLANRIEAIANDEKCERIALLVGGARYDGRRPQDAEKVIEASQRGRCHPDGRSGHPRGHASQPGASGPTDSVENYSRGGWKSGFLSRQDQDAVGHLVLESEKAQNAMQQLNAGADSIAVRLSPDDLEPGPLPEAAEYLDGRQRGSARPFTQLVIVLRHHIDQKNNPDADVFVHTFYPVVG